LTHPSQPLLTSDDIQRKNVTLHLILDSEELADMQKALIWKLVPDQGFSLTG